MVSAKPEGKGRFPMWLLAVIIPGVLLLCCGGGGAGLFGLYWFKGGGPGDKSFKGYVNQRQEGAVVQRVNARLAEYYNYAYQGSAQTHYCVYLADPNGSTTVYGYIPKGSAEGQRVYEKLKDKGQDPVTVELNSVGPNGERIGPVQGNVLAITRLIE